LNSRRPDLEIRAQFFYQLNALELRLTSKNPKRTASWNEVNDEDPNSQQVKEEIIIRNTYVNSNINKIDDIFVTRELKEKWLAKPFHKFRLQWRDQATKDQLSTLVYNGSPDYLPANDKNIPTKKLYRSILKVDLHLIKKGSEIKNFQVNDIKS
jgi:hypothetical protein